MVLWAKQKSKNRMKQNQRERNKKKKKKKEKERPNRRPQNLERQFKEVRQILACT